MKLKDLFEKWRLEKLKVKTPILDMERVPNDAEQANYCYADTKTERSVSYGSKRIRQL